MNHGTGYIHYAPTAFERMASIMRGLRIGNYSPRGGGEFNDAWGESWHQYGSNACTGFATAHMAEMMAHVDSVPIEPLSGLSLYANARMMKRGRPALKNDGGTSVRRVVRAFNRMGVASERFMPSRTLSRREMEKAVHEPPSPLAVASAMRNRRIFDLRVKRIVAGGDELVRRIGHSLDKQQPVLVSLPIGKEARAGRGVIPKQPTNKGWHVLVVLEMYVRKSGILTRLGNSWGPDHGAAGRLWASEEWLGQAAYAGYCERYRR